MATKITSPSKPGPAAQATPGFLRRTAAQLYDLLLLLAVLFLATALLLPFTSGESINPQQTWFYRAYLSVISFLFYGWFWTHGGQTLGLRAWKITVLTHDQQPISWRQALLRYAMAWLSLGFLGLGFLWFFWDKNRHSWHDKVSGTALFFTARNN